MVLPAASEFVRLMFRRRPRLFNVVLIETHSFCNRSCWFCKFGQERRDGYKAHMAWTTIERIVLNLKRLNYSGRISWYFINEPLLEKRIIQIVEFTRKHCPGAFLSLVTNGDLLDGKKYHQLRQAGLDALGVSVYDDKTYQKVVQIQRDKRFSIMDMRRPQVDNRGGNVKTNVELFQETASQFMNRSCNRPFDMLVINAKGEVVLCCSDLYGDVVMGNANEERLEDIWYNEKFSHYRTTLKQHGRKGLKLCDGCSQEGRSSYVYYPLPFGSRIRLQALKWLSNRSCY